MSHSVALTATQILNTRALAKALAFIPGASLDLTNLAQVRHKGQIAGVVRINGDQTYYSRSNLNLIYQGEGPIQLEDDQIKNGSLSLSFDSDYRQNIEAIYGKDGDKLMAFYLREACIEAVQAEYGEKLLGVTPFTDETGVPQVEFEVA